MASSSGAIPRGDDPGSDSEEDVVEVLSDRDIPVCEDVPRHLWTTKCVSLHNSDGIALGEGICHSVKSDLVVGSTGPLGDTHVAVHISRSLKPDEFPDEWRYNLRAFPITDVYYNGVSLFNHERRHKFNIQGLERGVRSGPRRRRASTGGTRISIPHVSQKADALLSQESINLVSSKVCCKRNCVQPFSRLKIRLLRERMYRQTEFEFRNHLKLDVHRQIHVRAQGCRVVTLEGEDVCLPAWRHIMGVPQTTFYRYAGYVSEGRPAHKHGNSGLIKPRPHTVQATATLRFILDRSADHMPHRSRTLPSGDKVVSKVLPATWKWKESMSELNTVNSAFGLKDVSISHLSKIRKKNFPEYYAKKLGDNFARCSTCDKLKILLQSAIAGSQGAIIWQTRLTNHVNSANAHRELYSSNRHRSKFFPGECVTIIHDKMDHAKTASPVFSHKTKQLDGLMKLPVAVTGMLAHGHGDVRYAHYGLDIFAHDANYTVGSFAKLLRDLERPPKSSTRCLFEGSRSSPLFEAVLSGAQMCEAALPPSSGAPSTGTPLPPILNVQMDNAAVDNKNRFVFCFWSLLVAKAIFREVYVNFMLVGHTHDDIDALFGRWSMLVKKDNFPTIPLLMKSFMEVESIPTIPHLIEEVPDFKGFIAGCIAQGDEALEGHTKAQQFKFYVDSTGCPVMKYKILCTDPDWLPKEGGGIKLWQEDEEGRAMWPRGEPTSLTPQPMRNLEEISREIFGFMKYWEKLSNEDSTGEYRRRYEHLWYYWRVVKDALDIPIQPFSTLRDGFWPFSRIALALEDEFIEDGNVREEYDEDDHFVGQRRDRPAPSFRVQRDMYEGYFIAVRPADDDSRPIWIGRAESDPNCNPEWPNCVLIQYFQPTSRSQHVQDTYHGWNSQSGLCWKIEELNGPQWEHTDSIIMAWKSRVRRESAECTIKIPVEQIAIIRDSIAMYDNGES